MSRHKPGSKNLWKGKGCRNCFSAMVDFTESNSGKMVWGVECQYTRRWNQNAVVVQYASLRAACSSDKNTFFFNFLFENFLMHVMLCKYNIPCEKYLYKRILDENYFMVRKHLPKGLICMMILCMNVLSDPNEVTDAY
jgi:hypothetical protein